MFIRAYSECALGQLHRICAFGSRIKVPGSLVLSNGMFYRNRVGFVRNVLCEREFCTFVVSVPIYSYPFLFHTLALERAKFQLRD